MPLPKPPTNNKEVHYCVNTDQMNRIAFMERDLQHIKKELDNSRKNFKEIRDFIIEKKTSNGYSKQKMIKQEEKDENLDLRLREIEKSVAHFSFLFKLTTILLTSFLSITTSLLVLLLKGVI